MGEMPPRCPCLQTNVFLVSHNPQPPQHMAEDEDAAAAEAAAIAAAADAEEGGWQRSPRRAAARQAHAAITGSSSDAQKARFCCWGLVGHVALGLTPPAAPLLLLRWLRSRHPWTHTAPQLLQPPTPVRGGPGRRCRPPTHAPLRLTVCLLTLVLFAAPWPRLSARCGADAAAGAADDPGQEDDIRAAVAECAYLAVVCDFVQLFGPYFEIEERSSIEVGSRPAILAARLCCPRATHGRLPAAAVHCPTAGAAAAPGVRRLRDGSLLFARPSGARTGHGRLGPIPPGASRHVSRAPKPPRPCPLLQDWEQAIVDPDR